MSADVGSCGENDVLKMQLLLSGIFIDRASSAVRVDDWDALGAHWGGIGHLDAHSPGSSSVRALRNPSEKWRLQCGFILTKFHTKQAYVEGVRSQENVCITTMYDGPSRLAIKTNHHDVPS